MYDLFALGNVIIDYVVTDVDDSTFNLLKLRKGLFNNVTFNQEHKEHIRNILFSHKIIKASGGSAANVAAGVANLGAKTIFSGVIGRQNGRIDDDGLLYIKELEKFNVEHHIIQKEGNTGNLFAIITKDKERTFATDLGVSGILEIGDIPLEKIRNSKIFHTSLYELLNMGKTCLELIRFANENRSKVSFDFASANLINKENKNLLLRTLKMVDICYANEEEAIALKKLDINPSKFCPIAIYKLGGKGALINNIFIPAYSVNALDLNGAGDAFAAGFIYGLSKGYDLKRCGKIGAFYASKVVMVIGPRFGFKIKDIEQEI